MAAPTTTIPFQDRILAAEHRFTTLTQNIAHFSPLKTQLDKHNLVIERLEAEIKKTTVLLQNCQSGLKAISRRAQSGSRQGSHVSLNASSTVSGSSSAGSADDSAVSDVGALVAQHQATKEVLEALNGKLLAAKILRPGVLHIGLTRQVAQYFESRGELQSLLEEIFSGSTPEHPSEDALEQELERITAEITQVREDFEKHKAAKGEFKEVRRYVDIWNDAVEKQIASNPKDVNKTLKKFVPFLGLKHPSYIKIADHHMSNARNYVPTLENIGLLSEIKTDSIVNISNELIIYTAKFKDQYNALSLTLETLHKQSRLLKKQKIQSMEQLFDERCKIFSEALQAHYRSVGERLAGADSDSIMEGNEDGTLDSRVGPAALAAGVDAFVSGALATSTMTSTYGYRQPVDAELGHSLSEGRNSNSTLSGSSGRPLSQELLVDTEELPSYFQYEYEIAAAAAAAASTALSLSPTTLSAASTFHRRTGSLGSPARSSSASSSISLGSPHPLALVDSPPDYEDEVGLGSRLPGLARGAGSSLTVTPGELATATTTTATTTTTSVVTALAEDEDEARFRAYHQRYDTRAAAERQRSRTMSVSGTVATTALDTPPGYEEARFHAIVDPV
ncbi:hypothetical protein BGW38_003268 [Lunasporangiospora selenospora]|uniref:Uncharacterized protein n=1 Tax=Lunasporangiospora selenospora TaxID=979761 RepID=A0A9P6FQV7_9FUNG|nr:hypothetical protein BGW38_003268 [Lunasporangiospora selenospora]